MAVFYHMIGDKLWDRDGPRSIGSPGGALRLFQFADIEPFLTALDPVEIQLIKERTQQLAPDGFQVWGVPSGANRVIGKAVPGDVVLLGGTENFDFAGSIVHPISTECWDLSRHIWGEQSFPLIMLLRGQMIRYPWADFIADFRYDPNYKPGRSGKGQSRVETIAAPRFPGSAFGSEHAFAMRMLSPGFVGTSSEPHADSVFVPAPPRSSSPPLPSDAVLALQDVDWAQADADRRELGRDGEEFVLAVEQRRLKDERRPDLAEQVIWVSEEQGDGAGYDISSFDADGTPRLIEVKTTNGAATADFLVTANEVEVSRANPDTYWLYRVYEFAKKPMIYRVRGPLDAGWDLEPAVYRAKR